MKLSVLTVVVNARHQSILHVISDGMSELRTRPAYLGAKTRTRHCNDAIASWLLLLLLQLLLDCLDTKC